MNEKWRKFCTEYAQSDNARKMSMRSSLSEEERSLFDSVWAEYQASKDKNEEQLRNAAIDLTKGLGNYLDKILPERVAEITTLHAFIGAACAVLFPGIVLDFLFWFPNFLAMYLRIDKEIGESNRARPNKFLISIVMYFCSIIVFALVFVAVFRVESDLKLFTEALLVACTIWSLTKGGGYIYYKAVVSSHIETSAKTNYNATFLLSVIKSTADDPDRKFQISQNRKLFGPYNFDVLRIAIIRGEIMETDFLWYDGLENWISVQDYFGSE